MTRSFTMNKLCSVTMATWSQRQMPYDDVAIIFSITSHPKRTGSGEGQGSSWTTLPHLDLGGWDLRPNSEGKGPGGRPC